MSQKQRLAAGRNPEPKEDDIVAFSVVVEDGLRHVVKYRLNRESRRWVEIERGEGREKAGAIMEITKYFL